ncbi:MAG: UDP-glucose 4-epimerase GalE [Acutalibacteraceae bacterium]|nr:UDP-glucose 4-epimerase GalE [Clostridia bacterium]MEE3449607.1 UDP-glucose 4-epimerase GalE [Acutalibacteraceae bacterium]
MKVLLTGGAGYIGSHTCVELLNQGFEAVIADDFSNSKPEAVKRITEITGKNVDLYPIDICGKVALTKLFEEQKIDAVIHFAGFKAVGESCQKPLMYYRNNLDATLTLLEVMKEFNVNKIVFSSSATVYGENNPIPYVETMPITGCTNPYGWTKLMIEQILKDTANADPDLSAVLLRYFNPIGAHPSGRIGEDPSGIPNNLLPYVAKVATGKLPKLGIFGDDYDTVDGTGVRDYIHVVDLARGHVAALQYADTHKGVEAINLGSGKGHSVLEVVNTFTRVNNIPVPYEIKPRRAGDLPEFYANAEKAKELLGWEVEYTLEDMCRDLWNWQSNNPDGY